MTNIPKLLSIVILVLSIKPNLSGQTICAPGVAGADQCAETCIVCDLNGISGTNDGLPGGGIIVCNNLVIHNPKWYGFIAGTEQFALNLLASNCFQGDGLQIALFDDCTSTEPITCNAGTSGGAGLPLTLQTTQLTPGQLYFLMIDGFNSDVCDYVIQLLDGTTACDDVLTICDSTSCLTICDSTFCDAGLHTAECPNDSMYTFWLFRAQPHAEIVGGGSISCNNPQTAVFAANPQGNVLWLGPNGEYLSYSQLYNPIIPGIYTLRVSQGACVSEDKILIKNHLQKPSLTATGGMLNPNTGTLQLKGNSIYAGVSYFWTGPNGFSSSLKNPIVSQTGFYTLTVTILDTGCSNSKTVEVTN